MFQTKGPSGPFVFGSRCRRYPGVKREGLRAAKLRFKLAHRLKRFYLVRADFHQALSAARTL